jgi:hypothetical protein
MAPVDFGAGVWAEATSGATVIARVIIARLRRFMVVLRKRNGCCKDDRIDRLDAP